jgi:ferredoxin
MTNIRVESASGDFIKELEVNPAKPLLKQLEAAGVEIPNACKIGMCGACLCNAQWWDKNLNKSLRWEPAFPLWEWEIMTCIGWVIDTQETIILQTMN